MEFSCSLHQVKLDKGNDCIVCNKAFTFRILPQQNSSGFTLRGEIFAMMRKSSRTFHFIYQTRSRIALKPRWVGRTPTAINNVHLPFFHHKCCPHQTIEKKFHYNFNRRNIRHKCLLCFRVILLTILWHKNGFAVSSTGVWLQIPVYFIEH